ncbi:hypothetical protein [Agromyces sp. Marseille-Q5079]|uniref:hypothetical protein n=1 Tax=Agromyces sp. Marseille-Q5079 TaxID=3439059 RepID=UPI003D9C996C
MSKDAARGIDPRFDPRFQRGYTPDAAEPMRPDAAPVAADPVPVVRGTPAQPASRAAPDARPATAIVPPSVAATAHRNDDHVDLLTQIGFAGAEAHADQGIPPGPPSTTAPSPAPRQPGAGLPVSTPTVLPRRGFWIALGASVAFVLGGVALYWNLNYEQMRPMNVTSSDGQVLLQAGMALATGMMQAGVLGIVVVLAIWAVRSGSRGRA